MNQAQHRINLDNQHHIYIDEWFGISVINRTENAVSQKFYTVEEAQKAFNDNSIDWYYV